MFYGLLCYYLTSLFSNLTIWHCHAILNNFYEKTTNNKKSSMLYDKIVHDDYNSEKSQRLLFSLEQFWNRLSASLPWHMLWPLKLLDFVFGDLTFFKSAYQSTRMHESPSALTKHAFVFKLVLVTEVRISYYRCRSKLVHTNDRVNIQ